MLSELAQILQVVGIQENLRPEHPLELRLEKARLHRARELVVRDERRVLLVRGLALLLRGSHGRVLARLHRPRRFCLGVVQLRARRCGGCDDALDRLLDLLDVDELRVGRFELALERRHGLIVHVVQVAHVLDSDLFERGGELGAIAGLDVAVEPLTNGIRHLRLPRRYADAPAHARPADRE